MIQQGMVLCHCHTDIYKHIGCTHHIKPPERKLKRERGREWESERDLCQIGKHLSSISVTTANPPAFVAMATGGLSGILGWGMVQKICRCHLVQECKIKRAWEQTVWLLHHFSAPEMLNRNDDMLWTSQWEHLMLQNNLKKCRCVHSYNPLRLNSSTDVSKWRLKP